MITEQYFLYYAGVIFLGFMFGSFAGATVWRLRARHLVQEDNDATELKKMLASKLSADEAAYKEELVAAAQSRRAELKRLRPIIQPVASDRSRCLHCHHELAWYDLLPIISWVSTRGKCRYCRKKIGTFEPLIEVGTAIVFAGILTYWLQTGSQWWTLVIGLIAALMLIILFVYDLKWFILPDVVMWPLIGVSAIVAAYGLTQHNDQSIGQAIGSLIGSVLGLAGLYLVLWLVSKGRWVGFGDVKLGLALGLLLADWKLAFLALFLANLFGTLIVLPGLVTGKLSRQTHVPFGPLLIAGFVVALTTGPYLIDAFMQASIRLSDILLML